MNLVSTQDKSRAGPSRRPAPAQRAAERRKVAVSPRHGFAAASPRHGLAPANALPEPLKTNIEAMSGLAMDDVRVHRNSSRPAALGALAYAQANEIHLGAGQERHLPHEAWHVVQQKQGRVKATTQMKGLGLNDDKGLEREADAMGAVAAGPPTAPAPCPEAKPRVFALDRAIVQRVGAPDDAASAKLQQLGTGYTHLKLDLEGVETSWLVGPGPTYRYIVYANKAPEWRRAKKGPFKLLGAGVLGRMVNSPSSALALASSWLNLTGKEIGAWLWWEKYQKITYPDAPKAYDEGTNQAVMGRYFLEPNTIPLAAAHYALRPDCEWLHMHGHGRGGANTVGNLYAGGHAANSLMLAVERVYDEAEGIGGLAPSATVSWRVKTGYHKANTDDAAAIVHHVAKTHPNVDPDGTRDKMEKCDSHLLTYLHFQLKSSVGSYSITIDPTTGGRLDLGEFHQVFDEARRRVVLGHFDWARVIKPAIPVVGALAYNYLRDYLVGTPAAPPG